MCAQRQDIVYHALLPMIQLPSHEGSTLHSKRFWKLLRKARRADFGDRRTLRLTRTSLPPATKPGTTSLHAACINPCDPKCQPAKLLVLQSASVPYLHAADPE